jgi:hypothetical protein
VHQDKGERFRDMLTRYMFTCCHARPYAFSDPVASDPATPDSYFLPASVRCQKAHLVKRIPLGIKRI